MVKIIATEKRKNSEDEEFNVFILQGQIETVISKETGKPYITARKCSIPCTFDQKVAETYVGQDLPGMIMRVDCDPYEYEIPDNGGTIELSHTYTYDPNPSNVTEVVLG